MAAKGGKFTSGGAPNSPKTITSKPTDKGYVVRNPAKGTTRTVTPSTPTTIVTSDKGVVTQTKGISKRAAQEQIDRRRERRYLTSVKRKSTRRLHRAEKQGERRVKKVEASLQRSAQEFERQKPTTFHGKRTAGTPTRKALSNASRTGQLRSNQRGYLVTPQVRKVSKELKRVQKKTAKARYAGSHDVGGIEDRQIRKAIIKHAPRVQSLARQNYGISGEKLLSKLVQGESGESQSAVSSASAKSITQFIPSTREDFVNRLGVDPWKNKNSAVKAATMHLDGKHGYSPGLEGYNPGGGQSYVDYILSQPVGNKVRTGKPVPSGLRRREKALEDKAKRLGLKAPDKQKGPQSLPRKVVTRFKAAKQAAKELEKAELPYVWGGGHGDPASRPTGGGLDCSGAVSYVLNKMGALKGSLVSGDMGSALEPGPGAVTVFYNSGHTFMRIGNRYFGTSSSNEGGGAGFIEGTPDDLSKYSVGHVPGMGKKVAVAMGIPLTEGGTSSFPGMTLSSSGTSASINQGAGTTKGTPGSSQKPIKLSPTQKARRTMKKLESLGVGTEPEGTSESKASPTLSDLAAKYGVAV